MDLREKKTRRSIRRAFLQLRRTKPVEKISVKELAELAEISKATFYLHYKDIFDLSETLQNEVIQSVLASIRHPEYFLTDPERFTNEVAGGFVARRDDIEILFSGNQSAVLPMRIEQELRSYIHNQYPGAGRELDMRLTYQILGSYYVFNQYSREYGMEETMGFVVRAAQTLSKHPGIRQERMGKNNVSE